MNEFFHLNTISVCASLGLMFHHIALLSAVFYPIRMGVCISSLTCRGQNANSTHGISLCVSVLGRRC